MTTEYSEESAVTWWSSHALIVDVGKLVSLQRKRGPVLAVAATERISANLS